MSAAAVALNRWLTHAAIGGRLSYRVVRARLTALYGALFVFSGAALMATTYLLLINAGFVFSLPGGMGSNRTQPPPVTAHSPRPGFATPGSGTHPSAQTLAYWRGVASCMRRRGITAFPEPRASVPAKLGSIAEVSNRDGAILAFPTDLDRSTASYAQAADRCGLYADNREQFALDLATRARARSELLLQSAIALGVMSLLSLGLGWLLAGRVLAPVAAAYEAQRRFVANASHELRAPLARQRALIQVALAVHDGDERSLRVAHERVLAAEQQLEQIIDALLTLSRGEAGLERPEHLDLAVVAGEAIAEYAHEARSAGLTVDTALTPARIVGDSRLIERLIANVIANALRHNRAGGQLEVATGTREGEAYVRVTNTGPLVGPEDVDRLLRPFERMGTPRTTHDGGHGLGLSIVCAIAEAHRARLRIIPRAQGGLVVEVGFAARGGHSRRPRAARMQRLPRPTLGE